MPASYLPDLENTTPELTTPAPASASPHANGGSPTPANPRTSPRALDWSFAGAAANVVLQLSWPEVAWGSWNRRSSPAHSCTILETSPDHHQYLAVAVLGSEEERAAFREAVNTAHRHVHSIRKSPSNTTPSTKNSRDVGRRMLVHRLRGHHQLLHG